jgi:Glyoxalase-like domain
MRSGRRLASCRRPAIGSQSAGSARPADGRTVRSRAADHPHRPSHPRPHRGAVLLDRQPMITNCVTTETRERVSHQRPDNRSLFAAVAASAASIARGTGRDRRPVDPSRFTGSCSTPSAAVIGDDLVLDTRGERRHGRAQWDIVIDCVDSKVLAGCWAEALGHAKARFFDPYFVLLPSTREHPPVILRRVPEPKTGKARIHFDLGSLTSSVKPTAWNDSARAASTSGRATTPDRSR